MNIGASKEIVDATSRWRIAKNASVNLIRGAAAGLAAILLPAVLIRHMTQLDYTIWILILQVGAYSSYLEVGLQTAVGRYVAVGTERQDDEQRDAIFSTAVVGLTIAALVAIVCLVGIAFAATWLFPDIPPRAMPTMRVALLIVGISIAAGLPSSAWNGVFVGLQRQELSIVATGGAKVAAAVGLSVAAIKGASLLQMATLFASINLASYVVLYRLVRRFSTVSFRLHLVRRAVAHELFGYCRSLTVWSMSTILVNGLDLIMVGRFDIEALPSYSVVITLITFLAGIQTAIFAATMPHAAILHARRNLFGLGQMVLVATRCGLSILLISGFSLLIYASPLISVWVGNEYVDKMHLPLIILMAANMIRLSGLPYATVLVASGQQRLVTLSPLLEGGSNLVASILLGMKWGAVGVAGGTLVGAIVGLLGHILYNIPRTQADIHLRISTFVSSGLAVPLIWTAPLLLITVSAIAGMPPTPVIFAAVLIGELVLISTRIVRDLRSTHP
jgi:O-antigen/teichoic acid export membrane protein